MPGGSRTSGLTLKTTLHGSINAPEGSCSNFQTLCLNRKSISFGRQKPENGSNTVMSKELGSGTSHAGIEGGCGVWVSNRCSRMPSMAGSVS